MSKVFLVLFLVFIGVDIIAERAGHLTDDVEHVGVPLHGHQCLDVDGPRHSYATHALRAGKSLAWVSRQLGHAQVELTLRQYSHCLPEEEHDLSFAEFGSTPARVARVAEKA